MEKKREPLRYRPVAEADGKLWRDVGGLDEMKDAGCYIVQLRHGSESNQLPLEPCDDEHYIVATLIVTESGTADMLQKNRMIGQTLIMPDCDDGRTRIFNRTLRTANRNSTWNGWNNIAQTGVDNEITSTEELVATVMELMSETKNIKTDLATETDRSQETEAAIAKDAILSGSLSVNSDVDGIALAYRNIDGSEAPEIAIPVATSNAAGMMSAEDKRGLDLIIKDGLCYKSKHELEENSVSNKYLASGNFFAEATGYGSYVYDINGITNTIFITSGVSGNQYVRNFALVKNGQIVHVGNISSDGNEEIIPSSLLRELMVDTLYVTYKENTLPSVVVVSLYSDFEAEVINDRLETIDDFVGGKFKLLDNTMIGQDGVYTTVEFKSTDKIPVSYGSRIYIHTYLFGNAVVAFFDDKDNILSWYRNEDYSSLVLFEKELDVPAGAAYFRASCYTEKSGFLRFHTIDITNAVSGMSRHFQPIDTSIETIIEKGFITSSGSVASASGYNCTGYVPIGLYKGSVARISCTIYGNASLVFFDKNKNVLSFINGNNASDHGISPGQDIRTIVVTIPHEAEYLRASLISPSNARSFKIVGPVDAMSSTVKGIFDRVAEKSPLVANSLLEKKILVIGDSISTDYYGNYKKWVTNLVDDGVFPNNVNNNSIHATGFVANYGRSEDNDFITRIKAVESPETYDLVIVFGGINDFIQDIPLGESGGDVGTQFIPAVEHFFDYLVNNFTKARIAVLLPLRTYNTWNNEQGVKQQEYSQHIHEVAKSYCLPVLNLTEESGYCPFVENFRNMWTLVPEGYTAADGVHPNAEYYIKYLTPMIKSFILGL